MSSIRTNLLSNMSTEGNSNLLRASKICVIGDRLKSSKTWLELQSIFKLPVVFSSDGHEHFPERHVAFVIEEFEGPVYQRLLEHESCGIFGSPAIEACVKQGPPLFLPSHPVYSSAFSGFYICFEGFRRVEQKDELNRLIFLIHSMGGRARKDVGSKTTHLVADRCYGEKYRYAAAFEIPIVSTQWLYGAWEQRHNVNFDANSLVPKCKLKPFHGARIHFLGFSPAEKAHMVAELERNNGREIVDYTSPSCTHLVIDDSSVQAMPIGVPDKVFVVKSGWFWASIQMDVCANEKSYAFADLLNSMASPTKAFLSPATPGSQSKRRKKRRKLTLSAIAAENIPPTSTTTSDAHPSKVEAHPLSLPKIDFKTMTPRQQVFMELVQTEMNYVNILKTIMNVFKKQLDDPKINDGTLLNPTQIKLIFGNVPPIYKVHSDLLQDFLSGAHSWTEDYCVGEVFLRHADQLMKAYPNFINFLERTKQTLRDCDVANPRFHAFLKVCQSKPECGRQCLEELLIRPVQRLPSITLLITDLLKRTKKENDSHPDVSALDEALAKIKQVNTYINEDKRKTEGQMHIFDIFNEIENCPAYLVSSNRNFVCKVDLIELGGGSEICGIGYFLTLFLFNDVLEVCKNRKDRRQTGTWAVKSPNSVKPYKHQRMVNLSSVKRVVNITDVEGCSTEAFALVCIIEQEECMFVFQIVCSGEMSKLDFLQLLCLRVATTMCRTDTHSYLISMTPEELELDTHDLSVSNLSRAYMSLHRKVGRALSLNHSPKPSRLKRAMSSMISPIMSPSNRGDRQTSCSDLYSPEGVVNGSPTIEPVRRGFTLPRTPAAFFKKGSFSSKQGIKQKSLNFDD